MEKYIKPICLNCKTELVLSVPVFGQRERQINKKGKVSKIIYTSALDEEIGELYCNNCSKGYLYTWDEKDRITLKAENN